jgi:hypothetical protein
MKNCLIIIGVLIGCAFVAAWLTLHPPGATYANDPSVPHMIASWRDYEHDDLYGVEINVGTDRMDIDLSVPGVAKRIEVKGRWHMHAFYVDSHVDNPPEIMVAEQLKNEDLEVDIGRFVPTHPAKIVCVKTMRLVDQRPPYPVNDGKTKVAYPPPKGLIRVGMLKCDLETLPWQADRIESEPEPDRGPPPGGFFTGVPGVPREKPHEQPQLYTFHSDRPDATNLLVTVDKGRVTEVNGGAEETSDIPYQLPPPTPPADQTPAPEKARSWGEWLFDLVFTK